MIMPAYPEQRAERRSGVPAAAAAASDLAQRDRDQDPDQDQDQDDEDQAQERTRIKTKIRMMTPAILAGTILTTLRAAERHSPHTRHLRRGSSSLRLPQRGAIAMQLFNFQ